MKIGGAKDMIGKGSIIYEKILEMIAAKERSLGI